MNMPCSLKVLCNPKEQGFALIATLAVMSILSVLIWSFAFKARVALKISENQKQNSKNYYIARAGLIRSQKIIEDHLDEKANGLYSNWWADKKLYKDIFFAGLRYSIRPSQFNKKNNKDIYGIIDEESYLNINVATPEILMQFDGINSVLAEEIVLYRYKKKVNDSHRLDKNIIFGPIYNINELLQIKGITKEILFGRGNEETSLADNITCYSSGKININSARPMVLTSLGFTEEELETILYYREKNKKNLESIDDFFNAFKIDKNRFQKIIPMLTVKSSNFCMASMLTDKISDLIIFARLTIDQDSSYFSYWHTAYME